MADTADAVVFLAEERKEWTYMCAHCDNNKAYPARTEMFVWKQAIKHLSLEHGLRRVWIEAMDDTIAILKQEALPFVFDLHQRARAHGYGGSFDHA